jgi:hypothetical protein
MQWNAGWFSSPVIPFRRPSSAEFLTGAVEVLMQSIPL